MIQENSEENDESEIDRNVEISCDEAMKTRTMRQKILFLEFLNFFEIFIHAVLYLRKVYPQEAFYPYSIYNLKFLKFITDTEVCEYISDFLLSLEKIINIRYVKKLFILIIDADSSKILEIFNLDVDFSDVFIDFNYSDVCLTFKSVLSQLFLQYSNRTESENSVINKTFALCLETKESKVITDSDLYEDIVNSFQSNFMKNLFSHDIIELFKKRESCAIVDEANFHLCVSRNYL